MKRLLFLMILLLLVIWESSPVIYGQERGWSRPQYLGDGWFPDITADPSGQLHVVWVSGRDATAATDTAYDVVLYTTSLNGTCWLSANDIMARPTTGGAEATRPTIQADEQGRLHLTYRDPTIHYAQTTLAEASQASAWRTTPIQDGYYSLLAFDSQTQLHLVYTRNLNTLACPVCYHLYHQLSRDDGLSWGEAVDVSRFSTGATKPQLQIDEQDNLCLLWESGIGGAQGQVTNPTVINFSFSTDLGQTWLLPTQLSSAGQTARQPGLGLDGQGQLVAVWLGTADDLIYYRISTNRGRDWTPATTIPGVVGGWSLYPARLDHYVMEADNLGRLHLILTGRAPSTQKTLDLLHLTWDGSNWSTPEIVASFTDEFPEWPEMSIAKGNELHIVWFTRPRDYLWSGGYGSRVWYTARTLPDLETIAVSSLALNSDPTLPAESAPSLLPTVIPTVKANPRPGMLTSHEADVLTDKDLFWLIVRGVLPAFLFLVLVLVLIGRWRRQPEFI